MITNERQYKLTQAEVQRFKESLDKFDASQNLLNGVHPKIIEAQKSSIESQIELLLNDLNEYEELKSGKHNVSAVTNLSELPINLIKARISRNLTQGDLAAKLNLKEQQIQRYEAELYTSVSLKKLLEIANALGLSFSGSAQLLVDDTSDGNWNLFPVREMYRRGWFKEFNGTIRQAVDNSQELVRDLFDQAGLNQNTLCLHKKGLRTGSEIDQYALLAWQARVLAKAKQPEFRPTGVFRKSALDKNWFNELVQFSAAQDWAKKVAKHLSEAGIYFVIEERLQGTHLDGAAMLMSREKPVLAMTLRHDRLDNFWFVLLHELAHIILHLDADGCREIFDDLDSEAGIEKIENEADEFSLNALIQPESWKKSITRFTPSSKAIEKEASIWGIHPSIIAGRLRRETGNYTLFNEYIGLGVVRSSLREEIDA